MTDDYYYDPDGNPISMFEWGELFHSGAARHLAATAIDSDDGGCAVSTIWLGVDHSFGLSGPPLIYETMIFGGPLNGEQWRTPNRHAALACHDQAVAACRDKVRP